MWTGIFLKTEDCEGWSSYMSSKATDIKEHGL